MLYLISIGIFDELDMSVRALETARKCNKLYAEFYTNRMCTNAKKLSTLIGKPVKEIKRADLEEKSQKILDHAKKEDVGILVGGDALTATTHISLLLDAKRAEIKTKVIHGSSILTAIAQTGLSLYKFGRTVTLPKKPPASVFEFIKQNKKAGLHTLILLDPDINARYALKILSKKISPKTNIVAASELGGNEIIKYNKIEKLVGDKDIETPAVLILPGKLHFMEKEYLDSL